MNRKINWNRAWEFSKENSPDALWEEVTLPHTWNGSDGQDGGDDYYRGTCYYRKTLRREDVPAGKQIYIEFEGANSSASLYVNGRKAAHHDGGYSTWRANITDYLEDENEILAAVDNAPNDHVYPQRADFTFYGGLYRNVNLWFVENTRFNLDHYGDSGVRITPEIVGKDALVTAEVSLTGAASTEVLEYQILDGNRVVAKAETKERKWVLPIPDVHLWNGRKDPHLYTMRIRLLRDGRELDERNISFGCRTFRIDSEQGFILNEKPYPLHGAARHQDRPGIGNALLPKHHEEDMALISEMGANAIRLAHYQHDPYFYDLCDRYGMIVWAEIPYLSRHLANGKENTLQQMTELICQNYNHPSIAVWGLSNETTIGGVSDPPLLDNHRALNDLAHKLDPTRPTTQAVVTMCSIDEEYVHIPDVVGYNHYYGWYGGSLSNYGAFFDTFHRKYPDKPVALSEYGCDALNWHTSDPEPGDYTEEYQAVFHESVIRQVKERPFIWATFAWNMFDFAADARTEGGEDGINHMGLVTFDRKYKKDAFYAYKAWLSDEPFVHICGKRYVDRVEPVTTVTVYSNQAEVSLFVNGKLLERQTGRKCFFRFSVPNSGESALTARAGDCEDSSTIRKAETFNEEYRLKEKGDIINWFEITSPEGYFSINDKLEEISRNKRAMRAVVLTVAKVFIRKKMKAGKNTEPKDKSRKIDLNNPEMKEFLFGMSVKRLISMAGTMGPKLEFQKKDVLQLNRKLNKIKK